MLHFHHSRQVAGICLENREKKCIHIRIPSHDVQTNPMKSGHSNFYYRKTSIFVWKTIWTGAITKESHTKSKMHHFFYGVYMRANVIDDKRKPQESNKTTNQPNPIKMKMVKIWWKVFDIQRTTSSSFSHTLLIACRCILMRAPLLLYSNHSGCIISALITTIKRPSR